MNRIKKYKLWYKNLYVKAKNRTVDVTGEFHHFIPKNLKNTKFENKIKQILSIDYDSIDDPVNIAKLTFKEHFIAHLILFRIFPNSRHTMMSLNLVMNKIDKASVYKDYRSKINAITSKRMSGHTTAKNLNTGDYEWVSVKEFNSKDNLVGVNYNSRLFNTELECEYCKQKFTDVLNYTQHLKYYCDKKKTIQHPGLQMINCSFCNIEMPKISIKDHERCCTQNPNSSHRTHKMKKINCVHCKRKLSLSKYPEHLKYHCKKIETEVRPGMIKVKCKFCDKEISKMYLNDHIKYCSDNPDGKIRKIKKLEKTNCQYCNKKYTKGSAIKKHEKTCKDNSNRISLDFKKIKCKYCGKKIGTNNIKRHIKARHEN